MRSRMWSLPYGPPKPDPYWGEPTSAVNFCEEDYIITHYIAEFINTLTSLFYILYGIHGIRRFRQQSLSAFAPANWPYWGLIGVGLASGIYHSTLKYHTQMGDEMSMHLATGCVMIQVFTFRKPDWEVKRNTWAIVLGLTSFVVYHCVTDEFVMHIVVFFCTTMSVSVKTSRIIKETVKSREGRKKLHRMTTIATANALFAWFLWNIDEHFCGTLTRWKHAVGMPWGIILELHGWWHILTAMSAYTFMVSLLIERYHFASLYSEPSFMLQTSQVRCLNTSLLHTTCLLAMIEFLTSSSIDGSQTSGFAWPAKVVLGEIDVSAKDFEDSNGLAEKKVG